MSALPELDAAALADDAQLDRMLALAKPQYDAFEEAPVTIEQFIKDPLYGDMGDSAWPEVVKTLAAIFGDDPMTFKHEEAVIEWGNGGGKSFLVSAADTYMLYWVLNLKLPHRYFGLSKGSKIMFLNQSIREEQARRIVFNEVGERVKNAPWFQRNRMLPNPNVRTELQFPKGVVLFPGTSSMTFPHGYNLFGGVIDEVAWFLEPIPGSERMEPAEAIYLNMRRRIRSRFANRGMILMISNPRHADDFLERHIKFCQYGDPDRNVPPPPRVFVDGPRAMWETKPGPTFVPETGRWEKWKFVEFRQERVKPDGTVEVVRSMQVPDLLLPEFQANPEAALGAYAAKVEGVGAGYIWDPECVLRPWEGIGTIGYNPLRSHPFNELYQLAPSFGPYVRDDAMICHAHVDLALSKDACGIAVGHVSQKTIIRGSVKPVIMIDVMLEYRVPKGLQVDFEDVRQLLYELRRHGLPIQYVTYDGWQSIDSIQQLNKRGIEAETLSVDSDMIAYDTFREALFEGRLDYYKYVPFHDCLKALVRVKGKKIDHVTGGKKDVSDGIAGICRTLTERWMLITEVAAGRVLTPSAAATNRRDRGMFS